MTGSPARWGPTRWKVWPGDDRLLGAAGADTYRYTRGDGTDVIVDAAGVGNLIEITGYAPDEITFERRGIEGRDLLIRLALAGDEIIVTDALMDGVTALDSLTLTDDGTVFTLAGIKAALVAAQASDGDDTVIGSSLDDAISGGVGADLLAGGAGNDTYHFAPGDGDDRISDTGDDTDDVLRLDTLLPADLAYALRAGLDSDDLVLVFADGADRIVLEDALRAPDTYPSPNSGVERIVWADGSEWDRAEMRAQALAYAETASGEIAQGFDGDDSFQGSARG